MRRWYASDVRRIWYLADDLSWMGVRVKIEVRVRVEVEVRVRVPVRVRVRVKARVKARIRVGFQTSVHGITSSTG